MANENTLLLLLKKNLKFHYQENLQLSMPECFMMTISTHLPTQPGKTEHSSLPQFTWQDCSGAKKQNPGQ